MRAEPAPLVLCLFGPFTVRVNGEPLPRLRSRKGQWLLALLALRAGRAVERDWLAALLWPESPADRAAHSLRTSLKDLRQALGPESGRLTAPTPSTLSLDLIDAECDLLAFDTAIACGDLASLEQAVALYQGPLLEGCAEGWVVEPRLAREQMYVGSLEELAERAREGGELSVAEGHLRRAIALDPTRETAQRTLMAVLAAGGSYTAALQVYRELRELLHREFNTQPDAETQTLFARLRAEAGRQARSAFVPGPMPHAPVTPNCGPHNLPVPPYPLLGRESELAAIGDLLGSEDVRLVTLTGPGGSGKTRLGLQVAADRLDLFREGVFFVDLAPLRDPALVAASIAQALGVNDTEGTPLTECLEAYLRSKQLLLLLDNFEHVLAAAPLLADLLAAAPQLKLLVTSRAVLRLRGEHEFPVAPLPPESAIELFVQRARALQPEFAATEVNAPVLAAICQRLEGLPLAIELAVGWLKLFSPARLLSRLETRLPLLTGGPRDLPVRQQTLRGTLAWSYDLLSEPEQRLLRRLSVFAGSFSLEAAEAVTCRAGACNVGGDLGRDLLAGLASLIDKSLLRSESGTGSADAETVRFSMLETIREFAQECLSASGEEAVIQRGHAEFYRRFAEQERRHPERLEAERGNLRAALGWLLERGDAERGLGLVEALYWWWFQLGPIFEAREYLGRLLSLLTTPALRETRARILHCAGELAYQQEDYAAARALWEDSMALYLGLEQRERASSLHIALALVASARRDYERAHTHYQQCLLTGRELGREDLVAHSLYGLGQMAQAKGDLAQAATLFRSSLEIFRKLGTTYMIGEALVSLAIVTNALGDPVTVRALLEESLTLGGGDVGKLSGGDIGRLHISIDQGHLFLELGDYAAARSRFEAGLAARRERKVTRWVAWALLETGHAAWLQGDHGAAQSYAREALELVRELDNKAGIMIALESLGVAALALGRRERAARLVGAAVALRESLGLHVPDWWQRPRERIEAAVQSAALERDFPTAWGTGRGMSLEQAITEALGGCQPMLPSSGLPGRYADEWTPTETR